MYLHELGITWLMRRRQWVDSPSIVMKYMIYSCPSKARHFTHTHIQQQVSLKEENRKLLLFWLLMCWCCFRRCCCNNLKTVFHSYIQVFSFRLNMWFTCQWQWAKISFSTQTWFIISTFITRKNPQQKQKKYRMADFFSAFFPCMLCVYVHHYYTILIFTVIIT